MKNIYGTTLALLSKAIQFSMSFIIPQSQSRSFQTPINFLYKLVFVPILTYVLWCLLIMKSTQVQAAEIRFLWRVHGVMLYEW